MERNVQLPGKMKILFTASGYSYPSGEFIYPNGIKIDHVVNRTIDGVRNGVDELFLEAIKD